MELSVVVYDPHASADDGTTSVFVGIVELRHWTWEAIISSGPTTDVDLKSVLLNADLAPSNTS